MPEPSRSRRVTSVLTNGVIGLLLSTGLATWALLSHPAAPGATAMAGAVLLAVLGWVAGALTADAWPWLPGGAVAVATTMAVAATLPASVSGGALAPPLGYGNADGALLLAATSGLLLTSIGLRPPADQLCVGAAVGAGVLCAFTRSISATACCALVLMWWFLRARGTAMGWRTLSAALLGGAILTSVMLGLGVVGLPGGVVGSALSRERVELWSEALALVADHPVRGVGAGAFPLHSPTARADPDLAWAHSTPLQLAAELGWVGFGIGLLLLVWLLIVLREFAMLLAVLLLPATVDYVLHFEWVVLACAVVLGVAYGRVRPPTETACRGHLPV